MSAIRTPRVQLGISPTSNNNFTIYTDSGTNQLFLTRGNYNSTLTNVAALETNGFLTFLGNVTVNGQVNAFTMGPATESSVNVATTEFVNNAVKNNVHYYDTEPLVKFVVNGSMPSYTDLAFDPTSGITYWTASFAGNATAGWSQPTYLYRVFPNGSVDVLASTTTVGGSTCSVAVDASGNVYWGVGKQQNSTTTSFTAYVYQFASASVQGSILPLTLPTAYVSVATKGNNNMKLLFDRSGTLYWMVTNLDNGTTVNNSYVYKITANGATGTLSTLATFSGTYTSGGDIAYDGNFNFYWAINSSVADTNGNTGHLYQISPTGVLTELIASSTVSFGNIYFGLDGKLYYVTISSGATFNSPAETITLNQLDPSTLQSTQLTQVPGLYTRRTALYQDPQLNVIWFVENNYDGTTYKVHDYIYKVNPSTKVRSILGHISASYLISPKFCQSDATGYNLYLSAASNLTDAANANSGNTSGLPIGSATGLSQSFLYRIDRQ